MSCSCHANLLLYSNMKVGKVGIVVKLTNRTILIIGNELHFTLSLINHLSSMKNKIIIISHVTAYMIKLVRYFLMLLFLI